MAVALEQFKVTEDVDTALAAVFDASGTATAGNLLITTAAARWGASGPVGTFTQPDGYALAFQIAPMEAHTAALAWKEAAGGETTATWTASGTFDGTITSIYEYSGITDPILDKTADDGSNATSVTSIATGSTGTLGAAAGMVFLIGLDRGGAGDNKLSNTEPSLTALDETQDSGVSGGATGFNHCNAWKEFGATTALNVTVASVNNSRMGAGIATFIAGGGAADPEGSLIRGKLLNGGLLLGGVLIR